MRMKIVPFILIIAIIILSIQPVFATEESTTTEPIILKAIEAGFVPKSLQGSYSSFITRGEFCELAVQTYETIIKTELDVGKDFEDTSSISIRKIEKLDIKLGIKNGKFLPNHFINREDIAFIMGKLLELSDAYIPSSKLKFTDLDQISPGAMKSVENVIATGVLLSVVGDKFSPKTNYTREQSIHAMMRFADALVEENTIRFLVKEEAREKTTYVQEGDKTLYPNYAVEVLKLINIERAKEDLPALLLDPDLQKIATLRADEQVYFFSHTRPNGTPWHSAFNDLKIKSTGFVICENLALGPRTPETVVDCWMGSPGHRTSIMQPYKGSLGIGLVVSETGTVYWSQTFRYKK